MGQGQATSHCPQKYVHVKPHRMASAWLSVVPWHYKCPMAFFPSSPKQCCLSVLREAAAQRCSTRKTSESQKGHTRRRSHGRPNSLHRSKFSALVQMSNLPLGAASEFVRKEVTHSWGSCCNLGGLPGEGESHTQPDLWWAHSWCGAEDAIHRKNITEPRVGWASHLEAGSHALPPLSCK